MKLMIYATNSSLKSNRACQLPLAAIPISRTMTVRMMATMASKSASNLSLLSISDLAFMASIIQYKVAKMHDI